MKNTGYHFCLITIFLTIFINFGQLFLYVFYLSRVEEEASSIFEHQNIIQSIGSIFLSVSIEFFQDPKLSASAESSHASIATWCKEASATSWAASASSIRPFRMKMRSWWALSLRRSRRISSSSSLRPPAESSSRIHAVLLAVVLSVRFLRASPACWHLKLTLNWLRSLPVWNASIKIVLISISWSNMWLVDYLRRWQWSSVFV